MVGSPTMRQIDLPARLPGETEKEYFDRIDPGFPEDLAKSKPYVQLTKRLLTEIGMFVSDPGTRSRGGGMKSDNHDLHVATGWEVKHRRFDFQGLDHFTRRGVDGVAAGSFASVIVDACAPVIRNLREIRSFPKYYWIWSEDQTGFLQIDCMATYMFWFRQWHWSTLAGRYKPHFMVPLYEFNGLPITKSSMLQSVFRAVAAKPSRASELERIEGVCYRDIESVDSEIVLAASMRKKILTTLQTSQWLTPTADGGDEMMVEVDPGVPRKVA